MSIDILVSSVHALTHSYIAKEKESTTVEVLAITKDVLNEMDQQQNAVPIWLYVNILVMLAFYS